ncbi:MULTISPECIES: metal-dependent peptidase [unclassified Anoxybacillus]|uniref:metal-dependent peptidase n=1 Tax=unclassified Anoxybacillus TaxID=2639704 RepID=UPI001ED9D497|nr:MULTISPECIES: metal-dependent peptidase [unclassified Anoxybacillus]MCG3085234.1 metal-dependent peptidase [Anoxybacillus sp. LAT27]MCG5025038.1 metal-dependent peptidase [Anoxybacillus flavithermus]MCG6176137.1 metal-dependent peptidase [Anoxybacillus sp. LAT_31]MCG6179999.1 metal-dependent peptidase [Anoxybacillus sp. LAT_33]
MEIRGYGHYRSTSSSSTTVTLKAGDVYEAVVKEQVGEKEAIVQLRGIDIRFRFEGDVPSSGRVKVQVTGSDGDVVEGKIVPPSSTSSFETFETPELRQAVMIVAQKQLPLTRETVESLRTFLAEGKGTVEQKLETIQIAATKKLDMTIKQLQAVHEALHGKPFSESLHDIVQAIDKHFSFTPITKQRSQMVSELRAQLQQERNIDRVLELAKQFAEENGHDEIGRAVREAALLKERGHETFARSRIMQAVAVAETNEKIDHVQTERATTQEKQLQIVRQQVEREPIVAKALTIAKGSEVVRQTLGRALQEAEQLYRSGQPLSAKERLLEAFASVEKKENVPIQPASNAQKQMVDEAKRMVRNARNIEDAVRQLKETLLPRMEGNELHEAIERVEQLGEKAKTDLIQALRAVGDQPSKSTLPLEIKEAQLKQVAEVRKQVENAPNMKAVEPQVKELARTLPAEQAEKVIRALSQAKLFETVGRGVEARQPLVQALQSIEQQLEPEYMNRANMIADRLEQQTMTLTEAVRQLQADAMLTKQPNMPQTLQQMAQMLDKQREQLFTAIATIENEQRATNDVRALIAQAIKTIQKEPNVKEALQMARAQLAQHMEPLLHDAFARADELAKNGREMAARQTVVRALQQIETMLPTNDDSSPADVAYESLAALGLQSKDMIVQTVTKRMAEATKQFQQAKRDMMRNLDAIDHLTTQYKQAARPQAKQLLETTIKQLDQTILKSDAMLFTDMTMEKKLLQASSQLAEAKKLLDKGQMAEAQKIVKQVKSTLEQMQFKPSDVKVKHFVQAQSLKQQTPEQALLTQWNEIVQPEPSARHMLQTIHRLGFMHEADIANSLVFHGESEQSEETMKGLLMKLAQTGGEGSKQAEQALTHMSGQQLLNKNDQGSAMQTLFFTIPLLLQKEVKDVKVYVNARNDGKRVDWENCSLYFLLETKKLGDVGVLLSANERTISVTFRNDREDFAERMRLLVETATKRLEEIGYRVGNVQFTTFAKHEEKSNEPKRATWTEKGYDFTI